MKVATLTSFGELPEDINDFEDLESEHLKLSISNSTNYSFFHYDRE